MSKLWRMPKRSEGAFGQWHLGTVLDSYIFFSWMQYKHNYNLSLPVWFYFSTCFRRIFKESSGKKGSKNGALPCLIQAQKHMCSYFQERWNSGVMTCIKRPASWTNLSYHDLRLWSSKASLHLKIDNPRLMLQPYNKFVINFPHGSQRWILSGFIRWDQWQARSDGDHLLRR